jgi:hypothetical protein
VVKGIKKLEVVAQYHSMKRTKGSVMVNDKRERGLTVTLWEYLEQTACLD